MQEKDSLALSRKGIVESDYGVWHTKFNLFGGNALKGFLIGIGSLLAIFLIAVVYYTVGRPFARMDARFQNDVRQEYAVQDVRSRIQNYEWFYGQYEAIKSTAGKARIAVGDEKKAIAMILNDMIAEYNSRSKMAVTRAQCKSDSLPYQIDLNDFFGE